MHQSRYWKLNAHRPDDVPKPKVKHGGRIFLIFSDGHDFNNYWNDTKKVTEIGELGHYSAFSPDKRLTL
jgi:hypothetical protein